MDREEVKNLAQLARLDISDKELDELGTELGQILHFVECLSEVDLHRVEPLAHPLDISQRLRADTAGEDNRRESFQQNAPHSRGGYYLVPKVID